MAKSPVSIPERVRVLCLGNDLLADDALGFRVARALRRELGTGGRSNVDILETPESGFALLDHLQGVRRLVVIDTVVTGATDPGTVLELKEGDLDGPRGGSPHYIGLLETLDLARALGLDVPDDVVIVAVEAGDYTTVGGEMTPPVGAAAKVPSLSSLTSLEKSLTFLRSTPPDLFLA